MSFPLGALTAYVSYAGPRSRLVMLVMRCAVAGIFVYMALFELKPPAASSRAESLLYLAAFVAGAACAFTVELIEHVTTGEDEGLLNLNSSAAEVEEVLQRSPLGAWVD